MVLVCSTLATVFSYGLHPWLCPIVELRFPVDGSGSAEPTYRVDPKSSPRVRHIEDVLFFLWQGWEESSEERQVISDQGSIEFRAFPPSSRHRRDVGSLGSDTIWLVAGGNAIFILTQ